MHRGGGEVLLARACTGGSGEVLLSGVYTGGRGDEVLLSGACTGEVVRPIWPNNIASINPSIPFFYIKITTRMTLFSDPTYPHTKISSLVPSLLLQI